MRAGLDLEHVPVSDADLITIGSRNNAADPGGRHYYLFHIATDRPDTPFCFEEAVGGGPSPGGGAICLSLSGLDTWRGDWRSHLAKAGCGWVTDVVNSHRAQGTAAVVAAILQQRASAR
jgi:hypothetical protein